VRSTPLLRSHNRYSTLSVDTLDNTEASATVGLITDGSEEGGEDSGKGKEVVLKEDKEAEIDVMAPKKDTRSTRVDGWNFKVR
jgi:protein DGCR14